MYDNKHKSKIENDKISRWRVELSQYKFDIIYHPGKENAAADALSRIAAITHSLKELLDIHEKLCHPGVTRLFHSFRSKNLPFSQAQVKQITDTCPSCLYLKPKFPKSQGTLIKAILPFQHLNVDFKGPLPTSKNGNSYLLTIIDEYSRFPFAYPSKDMTSRTMLNCFNHLFSIFGMPGMVHSDRGPNFLMESSEWETILPDTLHSIRSLLCTATNTTPHERLFNFTRKSTAGKSIPSWIKPGPFYIKNRTRTSKNQPPVIKASLLDVNPQYAHVKLPLVLKLWLIFRTLHRTKNL